MQIIRKSVQSDLDLVCRQVRKNTGGGGPRDSGVDAIIQELEARVVEEEALKLSAQVEIMSILIIWLCVYVYTNMLYYVYVCCMRVKLLRACLCTNAQTYARTHARMHARAQIYMHILIYIYTHRYYQGLQVICQY